MLALLATVIATALPSAGLGNRTATTLYLSPTGNDASRCTQAAPCATFDRAYHAAAPGDVVSVQGGLYPQTDDGARTTRITTDSTKTGPGRVTFKCAGNGDVKFASPAFTVQAMWLTFQGSCFRFHRLYISQRGSTSLDAAHLIFEGVHMDTIEITGADDVVVRNSEIGPIVDCYAPGRTGTGLVGGTITPAMWCDPNDPVEAYWATVSDGTETNQGQPFIHRNSGREATNITFEGNWLHGIQTKDPFNLHSGGFLLQANQGSCDNIVFRGNKWEDNFGFDILFDGAANCVTLENNWFGPSYEAKPNDSQEITYRPGVEIKTGMQTSLSNWLVRYNSFAYGFGLDPAISYSNIRVVGNVMTTSGCAAGTPGVTYDRNAVVGGTCGSNSTSLSSLPYAQYGKSIDFHLVAGSKAQDSVPETAADNV